MAIAAGGVSMAAVVIFVSSDEIFFLSDGNYFLSAGMHASSFSTCKGTATIFGDDANWGSNGAKWSQLGVKKFDITRNSHLAAPLRPLSAAPAWAGNRTHAA